MPAAADASARLRAVDAARGVAVIAMFVAHGYDGWVASAHKAAPFYRATREIAAVAMPSFVWLAGMGVGLGVLRVSERPLETQRAARRATIVRGLQVVLAGYALSFVQALIDGGLAASVVLRADALHAIGASIVVTSAALAPRPQRRTLGGTAAVLAALLLFATPPLTSLGHALHAPFSYALAPFVRVAGVTRFSVLPLGALCAAGAWLVLSGRATRLQGVRGAATFALLGASAAVAFAFVTRALIDLARIPLSPSQLTILPNALDGTGRALCALGLAALAVLRTPPRFARALEALGRRSLWIYALHLPLCYGRLATPLRGRLDLIEATVAVALLTLGAATLARLSFPAKRHGPARAA